jgi:hypothetical protein
MTNYEKSRWIANGRYILMTANSLLEFSSRWRTEKRFKAQLPVTATVKVNRITTHFLHWNVHIGAGWRPPQVLTFKFLITVFID